MDRFTPGKDFRFPFYNSQGVPHGLPGWVRKSHLQRCSNPEPSISWLVAYADKSLARPTSRLILFDGKNISFDASLVIYIVLIFLQL